MYEKLTQHNLIKFSQYTRSREANQDTTIYRTNFSKYIEKLICGQGHGKAGFLGSFLYLMNWLMQSVRWLLKFHTKVDTVTNTWSHLSIVCYPDTHPCSPSCSVTQILSLSSGIRAQLRQMAKEQGTDCRNTVLQNQEIFLFWITTPQTLQAIWSLTGEFWTFQSKKEISPKSAIFYIRLGNTGKNEM